MFLAFLSARLRRWLLMAFLLPLAGRVLQSVGPRVATRSPQVGNALTTAGGWAAQPRTRRARRRGRMA